MTKRRGVSNPLTACTSKMNIPYDRVLHNEKARNALLEEVLVGLVFDDEAGEELLTNVHLEGVHSTGLVRAHCYLQCNWTIHRSLEPLFLLHLVHL